MQHALVHDFELLLDRVDETLLYCQVHRDVHVTFVRLVPVALIAITCRHKCASCATLLLVLVVLSKLPWHSHGRLRHLDLFLWIRIHVEGLLQTVRNVRVQSSGVERHLLQLRRFNLLLFFPKIVDAAPMFNAPILVDGRPHVFD